MLNINDPIVKIFPALYLVSIYYLFICIYAFAYVYHGYSYTWLRVCILMLSLLFAIGND